jgi:hypothetical protein
LHDRRGDPELEQSIATIRKQLASAKERVSALYPGARVRWVLETRLWVVIDANSRQPIEASGSLDALATDAPGSGRRPASGTYRQTDDD